MMSSFCQISPWGDRVRILRTVFSDFIFVVTRLLKARQPGPKLVVIAMPHSATRTTTDPRIRKLLFIFLSSTLSTSPQRRGWGLRRDAVAA